jgi:serine/threonine protein kinase
MFTLWIFDDGKWQRLQLESLNERPSRTQRKLNLLVLGLSPNGLFIESLYEKLLLEITSTEDELLQNDPSKGFEVAEEVKVPLGAGTYGYVFRWKRQPIALKISHDIHSAINEYSIVRRLSGVPFVVPFYDFAYLSLQNYIGCHHYWRYPSEKEEDITKGNTVHHLSCIYMKYMTGGDWNEQKSNKKQIRKMMFQLLSAVREIEKRGVLHRDLKASNLMFDEKGNLNIIDFGLATFMSLDRLGHLSHQVQTYTYRAPEVFIRDFNYDTKIDIWSCGLLFLQLLMKRENSYFHANSEIETLVKISEAFHVKDIPCIANLSKKKKQKIVSVNFIIN